MDSARWYFLIGLSLIGMTVLTAAMRRTFLAAAILYLGIGILFGQITLRSGSPATTIDPLQQPALLRIITESAVIISLFSAGLKLRLPWNASEWRVPFLLASVSMAITALLIASAAYFLFHLPLGACLLLGGILAPTDPVLASAIQVLGPHDNDRLRFSFTAEAGLNDGSAFPFVMLGLGLLELRDIGVWGERWLLVDVLWGTFGGFTIGFLIASYVSKLIHYLRRKHEETEVLDDFLAVGLIALSYGAAVLLQAYGFLAVFAAGLAIRRGERRESQLNRDNQVTREAQDPQEEGKEAESTSRSESLSGQMASAVLNFNEQLGHLGEFAVVILLGTILSTRQFHLQDLGMAILLILVIRPISVFASVRSAPRNHKALLSWFGVRGIGSLYYLAFAIEHGVSKEIASRLSAITLTVVATSIVVHGLSVAPLTERRADPKK